MPVFRQSHILLCCYWAVLGYCGPISRGVAQESPENGSQSKDLAPIVSVEPVYYGEVFSNTRGGRSASGATKFLGLLDLGITFDLERSEFGVPGKLFLLAQNTHGRGLTQDFIGDTQVISNIDSFENIMQVSEYWWEGDWLDGDITLRVGKQDFNNEFQYIEGAEGFIHSTFGLSPSTAFPTYPDQAFGVVGLFDLMDQVKLKTGVWSAFARGSTWGFSDSDSFLVVAELERRYTIFQSQLPGILAAGSLYESEGLIDGQPVSSVYEFFFQLEQLVYQEPLSEPDHSQGLALFAGYYPRFPGEILTDKSIGDSAVAGLTYTGLFNGRDHDVLGLGLAWAELFQGGRNREIVTELFYRASLTSRVSLQPDVQYISSPSGIFKDALAVGARFVMQP
jgi:porin